MAIFILYMSEVWPDGKDVILWGVKDLPAPHVPSFLNSASPLFTSLILGKLIISLSLDCFIHNTTYSFLRVK